MQVKAFFDETTWTVSYVVWDEQTKDAIAIDPVLDYDRSNVRVHNASADELLGFVADKGLTLHAVLDTHAHADHLSGMAVVADKTGAKKVIGKHITQVQDFFSSVFDMPEGFARDGSQFDLLLDDGQVVRFGSIEVKAIHTPGHTPACSTYQIGAAVFTGDTMFMPDFGTGRCDFPKGSAEDLYDSIMNKLYTLPDETRVFVGHDYGPGGRDYAWETTIGACKEKNKQLRADTSKEEFVEWRKERDATLDLPNLLFESIQVNIDAGKLPEPQGPMGLRYLKMPLNVFD